MKLVLLGTTGYHPNDSRHTACLMIPELGLVLDAGTAMYRVREFLCTPTLDIFITHAHLDHIVGLTFLFDVLHGKKMERVTVHGAAEKLAAIQDHLLAEPIFPVKLPCEFRTLPAEVELPRGGRLNHFPLKHPGGALGFRLDWPDRSLAYVTDTTASPNADYIDKIRGVDTLVHECYFRDDCVKQAELTGHSWTSAVAQVAKLAGVGRLILVHINPLTLDDDPIHVEVARKIFPATEVGRDRMEIDV